MNAEKSSQYMLLFHGNEWYKGLSPEETQKVMGQWMAWFEGLMSQGKAKAGQPLEPEAMMVSVKNNRVVADGPFTESKEAIGGYFLLEVASFEEAVAIAKACPGLPFGAKVEVRKVAAQCPAAAELAEAEAALAHATA